MLAMPMTTVQKITGAMIIFTSLMKPSPSGFHRFARAGEERAEEQSRDHRDEHLEVQDFIDWPTHRRSPRGLFGTTHPSAYEKGRPEAALSLLLCSQKGTQC